MFPGGSSFLASATGLPFVRVRSSVPVKPVSIRPHSCVPTRRVAFLGRVLTCRHLNAPPNALFPFMHVHVHVRNALHRRSRLDGLAFSAIDFLSLFQVQPGRCGGAAQALFKSRLSCATRRSLKHVLVWSLLASRAPFALFLLLLRLIDGVNARFKRSLA